MRKTKQHHVMTQGNLLNLISLLKPQKSDFIVVQKQKSIIQNIIFCTKHNFVLQFTCLGS